jgi:hypothetical protein
MIGVARVEPPRDPHSLCIKHIPVQSSREEISALFEQVEGISELFSETDV